MKIVPLDLTFFMTRLLVSRLGNGIRMSDTWPMDDNNSVCIADASCKICAVEIVAFKQYVDVRIYVHVQNNT
jgi:hypothetical protein